MNSLPPVSQLEQMWQHPLIDETNASPNKNLQIQPNIRIKAETACSNDRLDQFHRSDLHKAVHFQENPAVISKEVVGLGLGLIRNAVRSPSQPIFHTSENRNRITVIDEAHDTVTVMARN